MSALARMRAMYAFDRSLTDPDATDRLLDRAAAAGITILITKAAAVTPALADACHRAGLSVYGSIACFSDHADPRPREDLRPVDEHGGWTAMEWYTGLIPTDPDHVQALVRRCADLATGPADGLVLDFLRWPLHWELELRPGATPRSASFDPVTLTSFTRATGHPVPADPREAARLLLGPLYEPWHTWREQVITDVTAGIAAAVRAARPGLPLGMFLVPGDAWQRRLVGQDIAALGQHVDGFLAMTYHAILHQPPSWVARTVADLAARTTRPVVTMVQTTTDPALARGADWGDRLDADAFAQTLAEVDGPLCLFPAEGMDDPRWRALAATDRRSLS
ncbi:hypothetical protein CS0771_47240 [Catellatospora sp. IY07-71]|uniref:hypothetical protein n=1 Tax=Catellatospora sp. IY07-71 TaxID=2728827 RepID=UPI001BB31758|nr:hypothetical protein [Catellatospora sp. IY07-71]BCJ75180.1 hypothetical protein CS0771_47240 [Catellatospora sp. IY07-71]